MIEMGYQYGENHQKGSETSPFLRMLKSYGAKPDDMKKFYTSVIRPTLEYAAQVGIGGLTKQQRKDIERIQRRVLKIIYDVEDYDEALRIAGIDSLRERRDRMCAELVKGMSTPTTNSIIYCPEGYRMLGKEILGWIINFFTTFKGNWSFQKTALWVYAVNRYNEIVSVDL